MDCDVEARAGRALGAGWQIWVDTGGTFTDCVARSPAGELLRVKVLSSSALRGTVSEPEGRCLRFACELDLPDGFFSGARLEVGAQQREVRDSAGDSGVLTLDRPLALPAVTCAAQVVFQEEAPILAARVATRTPLGVPLPDLSLRLATTRGTNALLERRGAPLALFVTAGFADLLEIGSQQRDDLFALAVSKRPPLYARVIEVEERLSADGTVVTPLAIESLVDPARRALAAGVDCAAVALMHSYADPSHELAVARRLTEEGFSHVSVSSALAARPKLLPRAETAVVNAYLSRAIEGYLEGVQAAIGAGRLHVMTSAGGLVGAGHFAPKDSLLSGPAGGVVGAESSGRASGARRLIAFDMGGTSTDVSRVAERREYRQTTEVGGVRLMAPSLAIETVAAGGGSVCWFDGGQVRVGPQSAGADPGPAAYARGGPLTLTDVNLLLGRISPARFAIPLEVDAARQAAGELLGQVREAGDADQTLDPLLVGLLAIADERMAEAIRRISIRQGYGLEEHALVAFGGAGAQHACSVAQALGIETILVPRDAGILSAFGLGASRLERFAERALLTPLADAASSLPVTFADLENEARELLVAEGVPTEAIRVERRSAEVRRLGQETTLTVEWRPAEAESKLGDRFLARYFEQYGYSAAGGELEIESVRLVAAAAAEPVPAVSRPRPHAAREDERHRAWLAGAWGEWPAYVRDRLTPGASLLGPCLVWEAHSATVVEGGWNGHVDAAGAIVLERGGGAG